MKLLFLGNATSWHVVPWVNFFANTHRTSLFSFIEPYAHSSDLKNVELVISKGFFGSALKLFKINKDYLYKLNRILSIPIACIWLSIYVKKNKIEVIHAHSVFYGFLAFFIFSGKPIVFTPMGSDVLVNPEKSLLYRLMTRIAYIRPSIVTGDSYLIQKTGIKYGANKKNNYVIQNGVNQKIFYPMEKSYDLLNQYNISNEETIFYSPRQLEELYNIDIIINSLYEIKNKGYLFKCMFSYGPESSYIKELKKRIKEYKLESNIIWLDLLTHSEMAKHYCLSDVIISIPSSDSSPRSVYEAAFCKRPIITSDIQWTYEFFDNDASLLRIPVRNQNSLTYLLIEFILDKSKFVSNAINSNKIAKKHFDFEINMKEMESLLYNLCNEK